MTTRQTQDTQRTGNPSDAAGHAQAAGPLRNPMVWLMIGLPLAAVVAGLSTLYIAIASGGSDAIPEDVRRTAQVQTVELGADEAAAKRKLTAVLSLQEDAVEVLPATGEFDRRQPLTLLLQHPIEAAKDVTLTLAPTAAGWRAEAKVPVDHAWRVRLGDAGETWRIRGRLPAGQRGILLQPALDDPDAPAPESAPAR
ncbi:MAG: FixH family protein [Xanthomonadales bacterium]|nr:FixH family protein [Xanthomonadales bacterium]